MCPAPSPCASVGREQGDEAVRVAELRLCFEALAAMETRGLYFEPAIQRVYDELAGMFEDRGTPADTA